MTELDRFRQVPESPTLPRGGRPEDTFDVADLYRGPLDDGAPADPPDTVALDEKLRQAYFWLANHGVISPVLDIEFNDGMPTRLVYGDRRVDLTLPSSQSYSSQILLPLLNLAVRRRCLLVGAPGRGKTTLATLMGLLAGHSLPDMRRSIQQGRPTMGTGDLVGSALPSSLAAAHSMDEVEISWRSWLGMRTRVVDAIDHVPDDARATVFNLMTHGYAELYDQVYDCPPAAWFLTADDDGQGRGARTIHQLRHQVDVVVRAQHFNPRFLSEVLDRMESGVRPEETLPTALVFTPDELTEMEEQIRTVRVPEPLRRRLEFLASQLEFHGAAGRRFEYLTKDTLNLSEVDPRFVESGSPATDPIADLGDQTLNGLSAPDLLTALLFAKALAWFRGGATVEYDELRQVLPFVLADKLVQNPDAAAFDHGTNRSFRSDHISWMRALFDDACHEYDRRGLDQSDPVAEHRQLFEAGLDAIDEAEVDRRLADIETTLRGISEAEHLHGHLHDDVLTLAYLHQRYVNYRSWLRWSG